jgi:hypothetical protein
MATLLVNDDLIQITLDRTKEIFDFDNTFLITRTDDHDAKAGEYPCENGYYYFLCGVYLHPEEAEDMIDKLFEITGKHFCDY